MTFFNFYCPLFRTLLFGGFANIFIYYISYVYVKDKYGP